MSDFQRSFAKAKLAILPPEPPSLLREETEYDENEEDGITPLPGDTNVTAEESIAASAGGEDDSSSAESASSASSTGTVKPEPLKGRFAKPRV